MISVDIAIVIIIVIIMIIDFIMTTLIQIGIGLLTRKIMSGIIVYFCRV